MFHINIIVLVIEYIGSIPTSYYRQGFPGKFVTGGELQSEESDVINKSIVICVIDGVNSGLAHQILGPFLCDLVPCLFSLKVYFCSLQYNNVL